MADDPRLSRVVLDLHQTPREDVLPADTTAFVGEIVRQHAQSFRKHVKTYYEYAPAKWSRGSGGRDGNGG